ncbi:MAG: thiol-disulfide oxidoreductase DCC family protein [Sphingobacteriales bacterium]|nr:thiol-disulfide oxidoreductase DCC family protein [Sphingobacteriales bacterium]
MNSRELDKVVLFDGVCNFCASSVQFIIKHDKTNSLQFASLQSAIGKELLEYYKMPETLEGVVFVENNKAYFKSAAAFRIARYFGGIWRLLLLFSVLPKVVTDFFYDIIARNRYNWFGKKDSCMIPSPEIRSRFLDV